MLHSGDHRFMAGHLGLNQALAHDAAVNCYFLTDLDAVTADIGRSRLPGSAVGREHPLGPALPIGVLDGPRRDGPHVL